MNKHVKRGRGAGLFASFFSVLLALGCSEADSLLAAGSAPLSLAKEAEASEELALEPWQAVVVPAEGGDSLYPVSLEHPIYERPSKGAPQVGYLRLGAKVPRSSEPVSRKECPGGWYAVRPVGFVCAEEGATLDAAHPLVRAIHVEPDRDRPMPYAYAFVRAIAPNYLKVPTAEEQLRYEMSLERHLRSYRRLREKWDRLSIGANDVPLGELGLPSAPAPALATELSYNQRFGGGGSDEIPWWLQGERRIPNVSHFQAPPYAVIADRIKRHAGVALIGTFVAPELENRRFAITTDARLLPTDKLKVDSGSPFHGGVIGKDGLPVAFVRAEKANYWTFKDGELRRDERAELRDFVSLSGKVSRIRGRRMVETRDGRWLRSDDLRTIAKSSKRPSFARGKQRWIEVSILQQTITLWEGNTPVYATLVSTGRDGLGDPKKTLSTPLGTFRIERKHVTTTMDSEVAESEFELRDVPWVMFFKGGYALHGAYWHDDFGRARSHGCINLSPIDARYVFHWSTPDVPQHWHGASEGDSFGKGTIVHIVP